MPTLRLIGGWRTFAMPSCFGCCLTHEQTCFCTEVKVGLRPRPGRSYSPLPSLLPSVKPVVKSLTSDTEDAEQLSNCQTLGSQNQTVRSLPNLIMSALSMSRWSNRSVSGFNSRMNCMVVDRYRYNSFLANYSSKACN